MFFKKKEFLFYIPKRDLYYIIKAKDESEAFWKLTNQFKLIECELNNYEIIHNYKILK